MRLLLPSVVGHPRSGILSVAKNLRPVSKKTRPFAALRVTKKV
jgi:hypothetical protein